MLLSQIIKNYIKLQQMSVAYPISCTFDIDERALGVGVRTMVNLVAAAA